jgi:hypothetical protein
LGLLNLRYITVHILQGRDIMWGIDSLKTLTKVYVDNQLIYHDNVDLFGTAGQSLSVAGKVGGYELFGNVVLVGAQTSLLRERVAVLKRRQTWKAHLGQSNQRKPSSTAVNSDAMKNSEPLVAVTELEKDVTVISFLASSVEDSFYLLRALLLPLYAGYYVELDSGSLKSSVHHSSLLTSPAYSNRLPPLRSDIQSRYGRWSGCDVYKQLEEFDSTRLGKFIPIVTVNATSN